VPTIDLAEYEDALVIHFGVEGKRINAYTLATVLVGIADAARAANAMINPGYEIAVVVEALGSGSFKATIKSIYRGAANVFTRDNLRAIVLSVIANIVYQHTFALGQKVVVNVGITEVCVQQGDTRIVIPRAVHDAAQAVAESSGVRRGIGEALRAVAVDKEIRTLSLTSDPDEPTAVEIPRERFPTVAAAIEDTDSESRDLLEVADLEIVRAILAPSRRKWEFVWQGIRVSAPILDDSFYSSFSAHIITIAPGDMLKVRLRIHQQRTPGTGIFVNRGYEVIEVIKHVSRPKQENLDL
jgi:hypothetical protein